MRKCGRCKVEKPVENFDRRKSNGLYESYCKPCRREINNAWYHSHPNVARRRHTMKRYGLTLEQKQAMFDSQSGKCAICDTPMKDSFSAQLDHSHVTGENRALLCSPCNLKLSVVEEKEFLHKAQAYLARF